MAFLLCLATTNRYTSWKTGRPAAHSGIPDQMMVMHEFDNTTGDGVGIDDITGSNEARERVSLPRSSKLRYCILGASFISGVMVEAIRASENGEV